MGGRPALTAQMLIPPSTGIAAPVIPATLARGGLLELHEWDLTEDQRRAMHAAGESVRATALPPA